MPSYLTGCVKLDRLCQTWMSVTVGHYLHRASKTRISRGDALTTRSASNAHLQQSPVGSCVTRKNRLQTTPFFWLRHCTATSLITHSSHTMSSKGRKLKSAQSKVFSAVEGNPKLLDLLEVATSTAQKADFVKTLLEILPTAFDRFNNLKTPDELFTLFTGWFGNYEDSEGLFSGIQAAIQHRQKYFLETRFKKRQFISAIGLDWTPDTRSLFFSKVNSASFLWKVLISFLD